MDNVLFDLISGPGEAEPESRKNSIKACSEALVFAISKCYSPVNLWRGFEQSFL